MPKTVTDKFYQLSDILNDDLADVAIVISHFMAMAGVKTTLTHVRDDLYTGGDKILAKYDGFIDDALDSNVEHLNSLCDKKLGNVKQLRDRIKELTAELKEIKNQSKFRIVKKVKTTVTVHYSPSLFED